MDIIGGDLYGLESKYVMSDTGEAVGTEKVEHEKFNPVKNFLCRIFGSKAQRAAADIERLHERSFHPKRISGAVHEMTTIVNGSTLHGPVRKMPHTDYVQITAERRRDDKYAYKIYVTINDKKEEHAHTRSENGCLTRPYALAYIQAYEKQLSEKGFKLADMQPGKKRQQPKF